MNYQVVNIINRFFISLYSTSIVTDSKLLHYFPRPLRHWFQQHWPQTIYQQLNLKHFSTMGSINCKEYVTRHNGSANQGENGTTGSGSYQSTSENKMSEEYTDFVPVCNVNDLREHEMKAFQFDENIKALVIKQNNEIRAVGNKCPHYGAPMHTGVLGDGRIRCPWHGACFNIDTGDIEDYPGLDSLPCFNVKIGKCGQVLLRARRKDLVREGRQKEMAKRDPKNNLCYVILGGGPSGAVCAETLRQEGFTGRVVMVCKEKYLPYDRVKLSKVTDLNIEDIQLRKQEFYDKHDIETLLGTEATKVDCEINIVYLSNDRTIKYDKMYIATGCTANKPAIKGMHLKGVCVLREYEQAQQIQKFINPDINVVCLGSSFIAMETAQCWLGKVKSVTLVSRTEYPLMASFGHHIGERLLRFYRNKGINMIMGRHIVEVIGNSKNKVTEILLSDDTRLPCDLLILGTGSKCNTKFLIGSGLPVNADGSIDADVHLNSLVENIYVGGDIVNAPLSGHESRRISSGHFQLAQYHGRIAGINMVGNITEEVRATPFFFTALFGKGFRYAGHGTYDDVYIEGDLENFKFAAYYIDNRDKVVAVASCGRDPIVAQFAELTTQGRSLYRKELKEDACNPLAWTKLLTEPFKCS